jgi:predicted kinase
LARLILLNGAPGIGKSSVARRYLDDHPLTLLVDIDALRTALGGWDEHEESKLIARRLALALADVHLRSGRDVVVPQFLGRLQFIEALESVTRQAGAVFVEVLLDAGMAVVAARFRDRRRELADRGAAHPQDDVLDTAVESAVTNAGALLERIAAERPQVVRVPADGGLEATYAALVERLAAADGR